MVMGADYFKKFEKLEAGEQKELDVEARVRVLWVDPFGHWTVPWDITRGMDDIKVEEEPKDVHYLLKGTLDSKACTVEIDRIILGQDVPEEDYDLCITSMFHGAYSKFESVRKALEPYLGIAKYTVYRNCCHKEGRQLAEIFSPSHMAVSLDIGYSMAREIVIDLLLGEKAYIDCGTDFAKAAEIAKQRGDQRREELYKRFEEMRVEDEAK